MGWNSFPKSGILTIADGNGIYLSLFNKYGNMSASDITLYATTYVNSDTRKTQNNDKLYHCLNNSLTASGTATIISDITNYHIGSNTCLSILSKILLQKAIIDSRTTYYNMRDNLYSIDTCIVVLHSDIEKFSEYVNINYQALTARGERCNNTISKPFQVVSVRRRQIIYGLHPKPKG